MITIEQAIDKAIAVLRGQKDLEFGHGRGKNGGYLPPTYEQWVILEYFNIIRRKGRDIRINVDRQYVAFAQQAVREELFNLAYGSYGLFICLPDRAKEYLKMVEFEMKDGVV